MQKIIFLFILLIACFGTILAQAPNGFYEGEVCELSEANIVYYNTPLKIIVDKPLKFVSGQIHSSNNENSLYKVSLAVEKVPENTWLVLLIDEKYQATCLRGKNRYQPNKLKDRFPEGMKTIETDTSTSVGGFVVEKLEDVKKISNFLKIDIANRKHFGHQLVGKLSGGEKAYALGDSILLDFSVGNNSDVPVKIPWSSDGFYNGNKSRILFIVKHKGKTLKRKSPVHSVSKPTPIIPEIITKGKIIKQGVYLNHWFDFKEPGEYFISWSYRMSLQDMRRPFDVARAPEFYWDDEVVGSFVLVLR